MQVKATAVGALMNLLGPGQASRCQAASDGKIGHGPDVRSIIAGIISLSAAHDALFSAAFVESKVTC